jgi:hypothetical protein
MYKSAACGAQMSRLSVDVENAPADYLAVPSCQERTRSISKSEAVEGIEQPCWQFGIVNRGIGLLETCGHGANPLVSVVNRSRHHLNVVVNRLGREIGERLPPILRGRSGFVSACCQ